MTMIHRYWQGATSTVDFTNRLRALNPGVEVCDWSQSTLPAWISELASMLADRVVEDRQAQHWANVARVGLLVEHGGWWADWDLNPRVPFSSLPFPATAAHSFNGFRCNCWMAAPSGDSGMVALVDQLRTLASRDFYGARRPATIVSGERLCERVLSPFYARVPVQRIGQHLRMTSGNRQVVG